MIFKKKAIIAAVLCVSMMGFVGCSSNNGQGNGQQDAFTQTMLAGYAATQQRDYPTALSYFQQALQLRPNNRYARQAVSNVRGYIQRDAQGGNAATFTNQGNR